jgi:hypothetical protein
VLGRTESRDVSSWAFRLRSWRRHVRAKTAGLSAARATRFFRLKPTLPLSFPSTLVVKTVRISHAKIRDPRDASAGATVSGGSDLCDEDGDCSCDAGCTDQCVAGITICETPTTRIECGIDGLWTTPTACPYACIGENCSGECAPGTSECVSDTRQRSCGEQGTWLEPVQCDAACCRTNAAASVSPTKRDASPQLWWKRAAIRASGVRLCLAKTPVSARVAPANVLLGKRGASRKLASKRATNKGSGKHLLPVPMPASAVHVAVNACQAQRAATPTLRSRPARAKVNGAQSPAAPTPAWELRAEANASPAPAVAIRRRGLRNNVIALAPGRRRRFVHSIVRAMGIAPVSARRAHADAGPPACRNCAWRLNGRTRHHVRPSAQATVPAAATAALVRAQRAARFTALEENAKLATSHARQQAPGRLLTRVVMLRARRSAGIYGMMIAMGRLTKIHRA